MDQSKLYAVRDKATGQYVMRWGGLTKDLNHAFVKQGTYSARTVLSPGIQKDPEGNWLTHSQRTRARKKAFDAKYEFVPVTIVPELEPAPVGVKLEQP